MPGPPPKPTRLKVLAGNPGKKPLNLTEPQPTPGIPKPPAFLMGAAKREWKRVAAELDALGLLTQVDMAALAAYCQSYARWEQAERAISKFGLVIVTQSGYAQQRPEVTISQKERQLMKGFAAEFGLTPAARSRINLPDKQEDVDPLEELLSKRA